MFLLRKNSTENMTVKPGIHFNYVKLYCARDSRCHSYDYENPNAISQLCKQAQQRLFSIQGIDASLYCCLVKPSIAAANGKSQTLTAGLNSLLQLISLVQIYTKSLEGLGLCKFLFSLNCAKNCTLKCYFYFLEWVLLHPNSCIYCQLDFE